VSFSEFVAGLGVILKFIFGGVVKLFRAAGRLAGGKKKTPSPYAPPAAAASPPVQPRVLSPAEAFVARHLPPAVRAAKRSRSGRRPLPGMRSGAAHLLQPPEEEKDLPYRPVRRLITKGEQAFWYPLFKAVKGKYRVFCKVRLADIVTVPGDRRDEARWFRRVARYHVDFVICDPQTTAPLLVIELDDRSHEADRRSKADEFKDKVLSAAGMPIYRVKCQEAYDRQELRAAVERLIAGRHG